MSEFYDLSIVADSDEEVRLVLAEVLALFGANPLNVEVAMASIQPSSASDRVGPGRAEHKR